MRFTGMGRDRKYEIRNTESKPMSKVQGRYNVQITLDTRCKKQEIRLSSVDIKILPKDLDSILFLESNLLLLPNVECPTPIEEC